MASEPHTDSQTDDLGYAGSARYSVGVLLAVPDKLFCVSKGGIKVVTRRFYSRPFG